MLPFTDAEVLLLGAGDAVVRDDALSVADVRTLRAAAIATPLHPAGTGRDHAVHEAVRGDHISWLEVEDQPVFRSAFSLFDELLAAAREELWLGVIDYELHVASYSAGAGYLPHRDTARGSARRRLTAILYLNADWCSGDGGELLTWPEHGAPRSRAPLGGRLVLFLPHRLLHAVAPSHADRFSVTGWLRGPG